MQVKLGAKIRELRKNRNIPQEVLAQHLGVSFQAVSKWENDTAMPDVTLIPAIASFFDVSTDELFDYNRLDAERRISEICDRAYAVRFSDPAESEAILRDGLRQFPGNDIILNNLLCVLDPETRSEEIITICSTLAEGTRDDAVKYDALRIMAETYHRTGQQALVAPVLERIPEIYFTRLEEMAFLLEGEQSLEAAEKQAVLACESLAAMLSVMRKRYSDRGDCAEAERCGRLLNGITDVVSREKPEGFFTGRFYEWIDQVIDGLI